MRLLKVDSTGGFSLIEDQPNNERLRYAILSHTWHQDHDQEVTHADLTRGTGFKHKTGYRKISYCAKQANQDGIQYIWVDTCCIDKSNNNINKIIELQYAINSMFRWYQNAAKCYVYLEDVPDSEINASGESYQTQCRLSLQRSRWFTRGWTLQELIAPEMVEFYSRDWHHIGSKTLLDIEISEITGIPVQALREGRLNGFSTTERLSWGERRHTKYEEDQVYSLFGICGVFMPLNYGEGKDYAYQRLLDEIDRVYKGNKSEEFSVSFSLTDVAETDRFVARESELTQIRNILCGDGSRRIAVLHGLGGIGKTQLTVAYAKRYRHNYSAIFWLDLKEINSLKQSFAKIANLILRDHPSAIQLSKLDMNGDLNEVVDAVKAWLSLPRNTRWLLVYDNYDNPKIPSNKDDAAIDIRKFFPESYQGSIIITTRLAQVKVGRQVPIKKLENIEDSLQILANTSGRHISLDDPSVVRLLGVLDGLPLALATAGAYLSQVSTSLSDYLRLYDASWLKLHQTAPELTEYEDRKLYSTWQISYDYVLQKNEPSARLLQLWAYLDNQDVWLELLQHTDQNDPEWMREITEDELKFNSAVRVLCDHGLVEVDQSSSELVESRGYSMHGCVHAWTIHVLNQKWDVGLARLALKSVASHVPGSEKDKWWVTQRRLLQHASRCSDIINKTLVAEGGMEWATHMLGYLYADQGKLDEAEKMYERALRGYKRKEGGLDHTSMLDTVNNLGLLYADQGKLDEAEKMYKWALLGYEKVWGPDHTSILDTVNNLGLLYKSQGKLEEAEKMYSRALVGRIKAWGPDHISILDTVNNLGSLYKSQGKLEEAEKMFLRALVGKEKASVPEDMMLNEFNNLGNLYADQGKQEEAEKMYSRALVGKEIVWGLDHTSTLDTVINLGLLYANQGKLEEAENMYSRALAGKEKAWGPDHTSTMSMVDKLAEVLSSQCYKATKLSTRQRLLFDSELVPQSNNHPSIVKLVDLSIRFPLCQPTLLAHLCRVFGWNGWDDMSVIASSYAVLDSLPRYNACCDGCQCDLDMTTGRVVCKSCQDMDLCSACFKKYELDELKDVLKSCQDHRFVELSKIGLENNWSQSQVSVEQWLQELTSNLLEKNKLTPRQTGSLSNRSFDKH